MSVANMRSGTAISETIVVALNIEMKNGFTYQGRQAETLAGSYGRVQGTAEAGVQDGNRSVYAVADILFRLLFGKTVFHVLTAQCR